ncbi:Ig-like domain-containing protein [Halobacterium salinarum]|uniref:Ig-like domain-containing protein n=1 Tax=Halobacterium salinarum TaxID=2242 RepID=UPI0025573303|nr:Ig-like domain-containing protein [Halobacterium salinarum]MDL0134236.1 Ig-like domain-containing protein [Halobacterium salinarum]
MRFRDDTRGVTVQVGAVLLFATIIIALAVYQATVVPAQNADVEYKHSQQVQDDLVQLRNSVLGTASAGDARPVSVTLGTTYPSRVFSINPPSPAGRLATETYADGTIRVSNVAATNAETRDYLNGTWTATTKYISYTPGYNEFQTAPTTRYTATLLADYYADEGSSVLQTDQVLVRGDTITLVSVAGSLDTAQAGAVAVSPAAVSAPHKRVQVEPKDAGQPVTVSVPTTVSAATLRSQTGLGGRSGVSVVDAGPNRVNITLETGGPYTLQTARVGVGETPPSPGPRYLTLVGNDSDQVTVAARDAFNNPVAGASVVSRSERVTKAVQTTGEDGRATFALRDDGRPVTGGGERVSFELVNASGTTAERFVNVTVDQETIVSGDGGGDLVRVGGSTVFDMNGDRVTGGFNFTVRNEFSDAVTITDVSVLPEDGSIDLLSDDVRSEGRRASELYVEAEDGNQTFVDVPTRGEQYAYLGPRGMTLSTERSREEQGQGENLAGNLDPVPLTTAVGGSVDVSPGEEATVEIGELYRSNDDDDDRNRNAVDITDEDVRVLVSYRRGSTSGSREFAVTGGYEPSGENFPEVTITGISRPGPGTTVAYTANANGDNDLSTVTVTAESILGTTISDTVRVSGETDTGTIRIFGLAPQVVTVTVTDADGNTARDVYPR